MLIESWLYFIFGTLLCRRVFYFARKSFSRRYQSSDMCVLDRQKPANWGGAALRVSRIKKKKKNYLLWRSFSKIRVFLWFRIISLMSTFQIMVKKMLVSRKNAQSFSQKQRKALRYSNSNTVLHTNGTDGIKIIWTSLSLKEDLVFRKKTVGLLPVVIFFFFLPSPAQNALLQKECIGGIFWNLHLSPPPRKKFYFFLGLLKIKLIQL